MEEKWTEESREVTYGPFHLGGENEDSGFSSQAVRLRRFEKRNARAAQVAL